ncbi:MAG: GNAT family N-acetyltransferase [Oscillospiraceae bacterium]|nr:GNAT family N-acetyltransferase [Oscillospiraceae bacterium]
MTEIYLIRHAQAEGNIYRFMQGHWDGDVTETGRYQIKALAEKLKDIKIDAVYSSDLKRAFMTAQAVLKYHPEIRINTDKRIREINLGPWEGVPFGNLYYHHKEEMTLFLSDSPDWHVEGAETFEQVTHRAYEALCEIAKRHEGQSTVIVSHGVTLRCLQSKMMGVTIDKAKDLPISKNTGISHYFFQNGVFTPDYIGDSSHLDALEGELKKEPLAFGGIFFRFEAEDPAQMEAYYKSCYEDSWYFAHRNTEHFKADTYFKSAILHYRKDKGSIIKIYEGDEEAGLLDLDPEKGKREGCGWISLLYLKEEYRGRGLGIQALGQAVMHFRKLGRTKLRLFAAESNAPALSFYRKHGFKEVGFETAADGNILLMEREI